MAFRDSPIIYLSRKLWKYSLGNRRNVILFLILFLFANIVSFIEPLIIAKIFNIIQLQGVNSENIITILLMLCVFIFLEIAFWIFHGPARFLETANAFLARANYKKYLLEGTMNLPSKWHTNHHSGDTIDKIEKGTQGIYQFGRNTFQIIEALFRLLGSYIALIYFNLHAGYIVLFFVITTLIIVLRFDTYLAKVYRKLHSYDNQIAAKVFDSISNVTTIIILRVENLVSKSLYKKIMEPYSLSLKHKKVSELKWSFVGMSATLMVVLVLGTYIFFTYKSGETVLMGTVYILYEYLRRINSVFFRFAYRYGEIVREQTSVLNAEELSNEFKEKKNLKSVLPKTWSQINIKDLNFSYHSGNNVDLHLDNISLTIKRNQRIAFIGESGSGKTTMLRIMRDLYHPRQATLTVDNIKLKHGFKSISQDIALIPQDPEIFNASIEENITLGVRHRKDYLLKFTNMAQFTNILKRLPKGLNSSIVEKGVNLSGGEKQRLALARGLLACEDKEIVLLDEPTSSVDMRNEVLIYENIFKGFKNKTIVSTIHRLHLLDMFDQVFLFKNGKIIASGTFQELFQKSKEFQKLWEKYNQAIENSTK
jgi:ATP-binding cassette, subfamily B, bacterial